MESSRVLQNGRMHVHRMEATWNGTLRAAVSQSRVDGTCTVGRPQRTPFGGVGAPVLWPQMRHGFGRARGRRAARRCLRLEMCMETAVVHAYFARHVPKPTRRGCGSAKLYPPEKALHERRGSNCSHGESARSTSGSG